MEGIWTYEENKKDGPSQLTIPKKMTDVHFERFGIAVGNRSKSELAFVERRGYSLRFFLTFLVSRSFFLSSVFQFDARCSELC